MKGQKQNSLTKSRKRGYKSNQKGIPGGPKSPGPNYGKNSFKGKAPKKLWS
jgi:ribosome modulation factor